MDSISTVVCTFQQVVNFVHNNYIASTGIVTQMRIETTWEIIQY